MLHPGYFFWGGGTFIQVVYNLKLTNVYFWNFIFNIFRPQLTRRVKTSNIKVKGVRRPAHLLLTTCFGTSLRIFISEESKAADRLSHHGPLFGALGQGSSDCLVP